MKISVNFFQCLSNKINNRFILAYRPTYKLSVMYSPWDNRFDSPPRKMNRFNNIDAYPFGNDNLNRSSFSMEPPPPPPPAPILVNCAELREKHTGRLVEIDGKVNRTRVGRFIELKDQFGVIQLVAPNNNPGIVRQFLSIQVDSFITVIGYVKKRPEKLKNESISTGKIEVHVQDITRIQQSQKTQFFQNTIGNKRSYSTTVTAKKSPTLKAITSKEYKKAEQSDNIMQYFKNRELTCDSLRLTDVNKSVSLVGWIDFKQKSGKFVQLYDGYGHTQLLIEKDELKKVIEQATEKDILLVEGKVFARPKAHQYMIHNTGEVELYTNSVTILNPNDKYNGLNRQIDDEKSKNQSENNILENNKIFDQITYNINDYTYRTHNCGELNATHIGQSVTLCGWLEFQRMKKFFTLRDGYGQTQVIIHEKFTSHLNLAEIPFESVIKVEGMVLARPLAMRNANMATGDIEVNLENIELLNAAKTHLPIEVRTFNRAKEPLRLQYRYIDLRFKDMQRNLRLRSSVVMKIREYLINQVGFVEVETPTLFRSTPGGAQEFVVPTRKSGHFYSLVQSPQQFKQMLMVGAIDRYFQIAKCYRDEATKPQRQPEFTQLDIELSFTNQNNVISLIENLLHHCWPKDKGEIQIPFEQMTYDDAMNKYGCDKPDTRYELLLNNVTDIMHTNNYITKDYADFAAYAITFSIADNTKYPNHLKDVLLKIASGFPCKFFFCKMTKEPEVWAKDNIGCLTELSTIDLIKTLELNKKDTLLLSYGTKATVQALMGKVRTTVAANLEEIQTILNSSNNLFKFLWVLDFPMFTVNEETKQLESTHHPFTAPHNDDTALLHTDDVTKMRSQAYDLVLNGEEIGGGSIRIHNAKMQEDILNNILHIDSSNFQHLLEALSCGCPPHGGIALGIDRIIAILCNAASIREVIAFPKGYDGKDYLSKAPLPITPEEMALYNISIVPNANTLQNAIQFDDKFVISSTNKSK